MAKRTIGTDRLIDGVKIDNLPSDTNAELAGKQDTLGYNPLQSIQAGTNITINNTDPLNPVINGTGGSGSGDVTASGTLTDDTVILGNGNKIVKSSSKTIVTSLGSDDTTLPTSKAVQDAILTPTQKIDLTDGGDTTLHIHDSRYYTETEVNSLISNVGVNFFTLSETIVLNGNTYQQSCTLQTDARYGTAVELTGPTVTGTNVAGGKAVSDAGVINSIPAGPITTHLKVRKISGIADFTFHYEYYKLASDGTETLLGTSSTSDQVHSTTTTEFIVTTILPATTFLPTDRLMRKGFFTKVGGGTDPVVGITVEGADPTYVGLAIPVTSVSFAHNDTTGKQGGTTNEYYHLTNTEHTNATQNASGSQTGLLSSTDWTTFNNKQNALGFTPANSATTITINGVTQDLSTNRSWTVGGGGFWTLMPGTPTRTSNTTFTVTGDVTTYIAKGMVIKWTESGTIRCGMVSIPSTYSSPNTTITIIGDTMASIDSSSLKYGMVGIEGFIARFAIAGSIGATGTDVTNAYYATEPMRVIGADLQVGTVASTSGTTTIDINKNGTTFMSTKATLAYNVASSPLPFTADTATSLALGDKITIDIDGVTSTTFPTDLYLQTYLFPTRLLSLT